MFDQEANWDEALSTWRVRLEQIERILAGPNCNLATRYAQRLIETKQHLERQIAEVERARAARTIEKSEISLIEESQGIPRVELIGPILPMFVGETIEPIPSWIKANEGPHTGLIADFGNTPGAIGQRSIPARGVIARAVYRDALGERLTVNSCCWLERSEQRIDFEPGEMHKVVLAVVTEGDHTVFALVNRRQQISVDGSYDQGIIAFPLGKLPFKAELVLIDKKGRTVFKAEFLVERDGDKIIGARKLEPARSDAGAVIGGGTGRIVAEKAVHLTSTVNKTVPTNTDLALKSLEPSEGTRADLEVAKDSTGIIEQKTKRGPKAKMEFHRDVAAVVHSFGPKWKEHLDQIAGKLDKHKPKLPPPAAWALKNPSVRSWGRAVARYPDLVLKKLAYALKMAARETTRETFETLANLR